MDANEILLLEALPLEIQGVQRQHGGVLGVNSHVGCRRRVGGDAGVGDDLVHETVGAAVAQAQIQLRGRVMAHGDVDVVQGAHADQLTLSAAVADLALADQLLLEGEIHILLGGSRHKDHISVHGLLHLRVRQGHHGSDDSGQLGVVAAAVGGAGLRVGVRMVRDGEGVHLADDSHGDPLFAFSFQIALHAGDSQPGLRLQAVLLRIFHKLLSGAVLLVAHLRVMPDVPPECLDFLLILINDLTDFLFNVVHKCPPPFV